MSKTLKELPQASVDEIDAAYARASEFIAKSTMYTDAKITAVLAVTDYLLYLQGLKR